MRRRICKECGKEMPISDFEPWGTTGERWRKWCKLCWAQRAQEGVNVRFGEGADGERLDLLEQAIQDMRTQGRPDGQLMEHCLEVWKHGKFPDGAKVESESTRSNALKLLMGGIGNEFGVNEYKVDFVLDAKLVCSKCGEMMPSDDRVSDESISGMFGEEE